MSSEIFDHMYDEHVPDNVIGMADRVHSVMNVLECRGIKPDPEFYFGTRVSGWSLCNPLCPENFAKVYRDIETAAGDLAAAAIRAMFKDVDLTNSSTIYGLMYLAAQDWQWCDQSGEWNPRVRLHLENSDCITRRSSLDIANVIEAMYTLGSKGQDLAMEAVGEDQTIKVRPDHPGKLELLAQINRSIDGNRPRNPSLYLSYTFKGSFFYHIGFTEMGDHFYRLCEPAEVS